MVNLAKLPLNKIRVIPFAPFSGAQNMALDYYFAVTMKPVDMPVLRFFGWRPYCLSLGYHQSGYQVNRPALQADGYHFVRRPTGGSAILHSEELTYSIVLPVELINHHDLYSAFHIVLSRALNKLGYQVYLHREPPGENYLKGGVKSFACFNRPAFAEIKYDDKKVVGSAQKLFRNSILQHGSILIGRRHAQIFNYLNLENGKKQTLTEKLKATSISLSEINSRKISESVIAEAFLDELSSVNKIDLEIRELSKKELTESQKFVNKFRIGIA